MKTKYFLGFFFLSLSICLFGQQSTINQLDTIGKKYGKWIEYLNSKWFAMSDSTKAVFYRYNYFDHGEKIYTEINYKSRHKLVCNDSIKQKNKRLILLDGEYKWYDKKGRLLSDDYFQKGDLVWGKSYTWGIFRKKLTGKKIHEYFDYSKKYNGQPNSFYSELYDKDGNVKKYYMMKGKNGWAFYEL